MAVIGPDTADKLFGRKENVTGETIRLAGQPFRVIGVLESKGGGAMGSEDNQVLVPFSTAQTRLIRRSPSNRVDRILLGTRVAPSPTGGMALTWSSPQR